MHLNDPDEGASCWCPRVSLREIALRPWMVYKVHMRSSYSAVFCLLLSFSVSERASNAQSGQQPDSIKVKTEVIQLRAVVNDRKGRPVEGLTKDDFLLTEDGVAQPIEFFSQLRLLHGSQTNTPPTGRSRSGQNVETSGVVPGTARSQRFILLLVDLIHNSPEGLSNTRTVLKRLVAEQIGEYDQIAVAASSDPAKFTGNRDVLQVEIDKIPAIPILDQQLYPDPLLTPSNAARIVRGESDRFPPGVPPQAAASLLQQVSTRRDMLLARAKAAVSILGEQPGQRILAIFSEGISMVDRRGELATAALYPVISQATRSGVMIYCFDVRGLRPAMMAAAMERPSSVNYSDARHSADPVGRTIDDHKRDMQSCMNAMANETGGEAFFDTNKWSEMTSRMLENNQVFYELAYYPSDKADPSRFRRIALKVRNHPEYKVRTQKGYVLAELRQSPVDSHKLELDDLYKSLREGTLATDVSITPTMSVIAQTEEGADVEFRVHIRGEDVRQREQDGGFYTEIEILILVDDPKGKEILTFREKVRGTLNSAQLAASRMKGFVYTKKAHLPLGEYATKIGLIDTVGRRTGVTGLHVTIPSPRP